MSATSATGGRAARPRRRVGRPTSWTSDRQAAFLTMLQSWLNVSKAAGAVGLTARSAYQLKQRDPAFARSWAEALDMGYGELEIELLRQSMHGTTRTETVQQDRDGPIKQIKTVHSFPHGMAMRLLQAHREEVQAFRLAGAGQEEDDAVGERVLAQMDLVRARLIGGAESGGDEPGEGESGGDESGPDDAG